MGAHMRNWHRIFAVLVAGLVAVSVAVGAFGPSPTAWAADPQLRVVQEQLNAQGYDAGPADGVMGPRTRAAIRTFEADRGMPVTGEKSVDIWRALMAAGDSEPTPARAAPRAAEIPPGANAKRLATPPELPANTRPPGRQERETNGAGDDEGGSVFVNRHWTFQDRTTAGLNAGPAFGLFLQPDGRVAGPRFADRMKWQADGRRLVVRYRNAIGQEIVREGDLAGDNRIVGGAEGPHGKTWRWTAEAEPRRSHRAVQR